MSCHSECNEESLAMGFFGMRLMVTVPQGDEQVFQIIIDIHIIY
ncbi:hypothetical protein OF66_0045 [Seleniivibrio woodruffii]|uniref:Uncharacterized protein n=1 Tax=Seleniivibrio woodruffii TaxID=1078050 RepID=A0A4R1KD03_9BACT|nr:hypothetical protein C8D98_0948 [Seleniivibrio woodruffii]TVZ34460.1 hypothetical protein OF66_0045 [Seleniivibrio woodruffii]